MFIASYEYCWLLGSPFDAAEAPHLPSTTNLLPGSMLVQPPQVPTNRLRKVLLAHFLVHRVISVSA